ncbi:type III secretion system chaperone [Paraburkholderia agricolaris]|uniref:type III secretion system chaperone n=1 Tax=Paraburkholderia agricolaris TaxID=2152888 RepID=UPI001291AFD8|nr:type III secretion system chaperone [Paraburkholderia agricolaris]
MDTKAMAIQIGIVIGLPQLQLDDRGLALVQIEGCPSLHIEADPDGQCLHLYSIVASNVHSVLHDACLMLLKGNTFGSKTGGASLAFDEPAGEIILCARLEDMVVGADALKNYLERFAAAAKYWVAEYEMHARTSARAAAPQNAVAFRRDWQLLAGRV